jgi:hypothetical protein
LRLCQNSRSPRTRSFCWIFWRRETSGLLACPIKVSRAFLMNAVRCWLRVPLRPNQSIRSKPTRCTREHLWARNAKTLVVLPRVRAWLSFGLLVRGMIHAPPQSAYLWAHSCGCRAPPSRASGRVPRPSLTHAHPLRSLAPHRNRASGSVTRTPSPSGKAPPAAPHVGRVAAALPATGAEPHPKRRRGENHAQRQGPGTCS